MGEEPGSPLSRFIVEVEVAIILDSIGCDESLGLRLANIEIAEIALLNRPQPNHYWFQVLLKNAITSNDPLTRGDITSENRQRILAAGSEMLIGQGADEVTFRSVAAKAGITFSAVASLYRRREVLLASICNFMVMRAITVAPPPPGTRDLAWVCEVACDMLTGEGSFAGEFFFMGSVELRLLAARDSLASGLVRRLRVMNGLYEQRKDDPDYDPFGATAFAVHARQLWAQGAALILGATGSHEGLRPALLERLSAEAPRFELGEFRRAIVRSPL
jgi:AcrR family transcriptional regulator